MDLKSPIQSLKALRQSSLCALATEQQKAYLFDLEFRKVIRTFDNFGRKVQDLVWQIRFSEAAVLPL